MTINNRFNGKCKGCGFKVSLFVVSIRYNGERRDYVAVDENGQEHGSWDNGVVRMAHVCATHFRLTLHPVQGKLAPEHICNAKCMASIGFQCECSCGGKNHGASFAA
jgi:hypothetical protein